MVILGTFKLEKSDNFDEYMKAIGVGMVMRTMGAKAHPTTEITQDGDNWKIKTITTFKTTEINFKLGEEFQEETADGRKCQTTITKEGDNKLIHTQKVDGKTFVILREFTEKELTMTLEAPGVVCTRIYKRL